VTLACIPVDTSISQGLFPSFSYRTLFSVLAYLVKLAYLACVAVDVRH